ncbi:MAG: anti-sigma factor family protein [Candidatus Bipolaricaulia bacterium]
MSERDQLKEIIAAPLEEIAYSSHPSEGVLREYSGGRLTRSGSFDIVGLQSGSMARWHRAEITAHLLTCRRCAQLVAELRREPSRLHVFIQRLSPLREPVPAFARAVMLAQFVIILGLVGVIYFKPAPFFSSLSPTAAVIPSQDIKKAQPQAPPPPQPLTLPSSEALSDPIAQVMQAHPLTVRIALRAETPIRELENLLQGINGILIFTRQDGFVMRLAADEQLESILEKLSHSPYIIEARKD